MKVNNPLDDILNSKVKIECLRHLCSYPTELNGRQLSKFLGITPKSIHKAMSSLVDEGVVNFNSHGNSFGYSINRNKWINKQLLLPLFRKEKTLLDTISRSLRMELTSWPLKRHILSVALFGSVQKKEDNNRSDFDLFILVDKERAVPEVEEKIGKVGSLFTKAFGIVFGPYVKSVASFKKDKSLNVIKSILSSNKVIYGKELTEYGR
jgi:predicted nucleotidyltransferase